MEVKKIDICQNSGELKELILQYPELPVVALTDTKVFADDYHYWYGQHIDFRIGKLLTISKGGIDIIIDDETSLEDYLIDEFSSDFRYDSLSDREFERLVKSKMAEFGPSWTECIVLYIHS